MRRPLGLLLLFLGLAGLTAQTNDEWYLGKPIRDVTFKGLSTVSVTELDGIVGPYRGKLFTHDLFWELQGRLYALDYFDVIIPNALPADPNRTAVIIEFTVEERPQVAEVQVRGNDRVRANEILDVVVMKKGDIFNSAKVKVDEDAIRKLYLERGFPDVTVASIVEANDVENTRTVVFTVAEGSQTSIRKIEFSGNSFASEGTLKGVMESKEQSLFNSGIYQETKIEADRRSIERYYRERGYVDSRVVDVRKEFERDEENNRTYVNITVFLNEGTQWTYGGMTFAGNQIFETTRLDGLVRQRPGGVLNMTRVEQDFQRVADLYYENGYIFNSINREEVRDERTKTVSFVVTIVERGRAHIENIILKGNTKTKDFVIFREIPLEVGDIFSKAKIVEGLQNLHNLQYFSSITPETPPGSADGLMDLVINLEEANTADIRFGASFGGSAEFPISGQVKWTDSNFLGVGQVIGAEINASPVVQSLRVNFTERWLFGQRWSGGFEFSIRHALVSGIPQDALFPIFDGQNPGEDAFPDPFTGEYVHKDSGKPFGRTPTSEEIEQFNLVTDYEYAGGSTAIVPSQYRMTYDSYDIGFGINTGYRFRTPVGVLGLGTGLGTTLTYIDYDEELFRPYLAADRANNQHWLFTNALSLSASLDRRDYWFNPTSGYYGKQSVRFVGGFLFGQKHFIRTDTKAEYFHTLLDLPVVQDWSFKVVLGLHSQLSLIHPQFWVPDDKEPLTAGTSDRLFIDGMYIARGWPRELDKRAILDNWVELRIPLAAQIIWLDFFFDAVGRWDDPEELKEIRLEDFLFGYGVGFRFVIPQFPIRIYLAKRFKFGPEGIEWQTGPLFRDEAGLDFVFSIGYELFNQ